MAAALAALVLSSHATVVAAWDFGDRRGRTVPSGWTIWSTADMSNKVSSTVGGLTLGIDYAAGNFAVNAKQINANANFIAEDPALLTLATDTAGQRVYEDYLAQLNTADPVFTLSGLDAGKEYRVQFLGSFSADGKNISVSQDGAGAINIIEGTNSVANDVAYSRYFSFTASAGDTDVAFQLDNINGNNLNQGVSGMMVEIVPEPAALGLLSAAGGLLLWIRRRFAI